MTATTVNVHEPRDGSLRVGADVKTSDVSMDAYCVLELGPVTFFVRDSMTLMKLCAAASEAFVTLSNAQRADVDDFGCNPIIGHHTDPHTCGDQADDDDEATA